MEKEEEEEQVEDDDFFPMSLCDLLVSFFFFFCRFPAPPKLALLHEGLLGSVVVGMCTG